jgi:hypothetical protein
MAPMCEGQICFAWGIHHGDREVDSTLGKVSARTVARLDGATVAVELTIRRAGCRSSRESDCLTLSCRRHKVRES